jgi:mannose-6-phosphate isomerase-like protein (cupin superfamily)
MAHSPYLARLAASLPGGASVLHCGAGGVAYLVRPGCVEPLDPTRGPRGPELLPFIDPGHFTRYLIGAADTSDTKPSNATFKLGMVAAHRGFTPHAHGAEHFVFSTGYAACALFDGVRDAVVHVRMAPGSLLHIPAMMPHSFSNRSSVPLLLLVANTGMGIDHEDYAITAAQLVARREAGAAQPDDLALAAALRRLEAALPARHEQPRLSWRERLARRLRAAAERLEHQP